MKAPLAYVAAAALALTAGWQARSLSGLRQENAALRIRLDDAEARAAAKPVPVRAETAPDAEVLRLRAKVAELTRLQKAAARPVVAAPASAAPVAEIQPSESEIEEYTQRRMNIVNGGKTLGLAARIFASDNQDVLPTSFDQILATLIPPPPTGEPVLPGGIRLDHFEFYPQPRVISEAEPQLILFRERQAEARPGGGWTRVYVLVDGSVQQVSSEERMAQIEREGTAH